MLLHVKYTITWTPQSKGKQITGEVAQRQKPMRNLRSLSTSQAKKSFGTVRDLNQFTFASQPQLKQKRARGYHLVT